MRSHLCGHEAHRGLRRQARALTGGAVVLALLVGACGNASSKGSTTKAPPTSAGAPTNASAPSTASAPISAAPTTAPGPTVPGDTDGITPTQVSVGALVTATGPIGGAYAQIVQGVKAYFDLVNTKGGINGRHLVVSNVIDDQTNPSRNSSQARALVEDDHVFAVFASSPLFPAGTYLAQKGIPTFGTNFNAEWHSGPSLFGNNGSFNNVTMPGPYLSFLAKKTGATAAALVAYTVAQSRYRQDLWMRFRAQRPSGHHLWADDLLSRRLMDGPFAIWSGSKRSLRATGSSQLGHSAPGPSRRHQELQSSHRCSPR